MAATRIALWGYGTYGRCLEQVLSRRPLRQYEVTAVFDLRFSELGKTVYLGVDVLDPARIKELYRSGLFEEVLPAVYSPMQRKELASILRDCGVPVCTVSCWTRMEPAEFFDAWEKPLPMKQEGYTMHVLRDQCLELLKHMDLFFVYGGDGILNRAYWHTYQRSFDLVTKIYYPDPELPVKELKGEWFLLGAVFSRNYWHFTYECLDRLWIMEQSGYKGKYLVNRTGFSAELLKLFGVEDERIVWIETLEYNTVYHFEKLICLTIRNYYLHYAAPVLLEASESARKKLAPAVGSPPERVFVKRIGKRKLQIDPEVLSRYGFATFIPEQLSVEEQIRLFAGAKIVLCPHGANSTNSLYMHPGSVFIETFPNTYINPLCLETLARKGVYYLSVTQRLEPSQKKQTDPDADYTVDPICLELAMNAAEKLITADSNPSPRACASPLR